MDAWTIKKTIDLAKPPTIGRELPYLLMVPGDENAHKWEITVLNNGQPAALTNMTASGHFLRHDNTLVTCSGGNASIQSNVVTITFRAECYNVPGGMRGAVRITGSMGTITLADQAFFVQPALDGQVVEDEYIPSLVELLGNLDQLKQQNAIGMLLASISGLMTAYVDGETLVINKVSIGDSGAYAAAVAAGYEGTEMQWNAFVAAVTNNTSMISEANQNASQALSTANSKAAVTSASVSVPASGWTGSSVPYTQTVSCSIATASNNLIVGVGGAMTQAQKEAIDNANIVCTGQASGTITLSAFGIKPTVDITVNVLGVN